MVRFPQNQDVNHSHDINFEWKLSNLDFKFNVEVWSVIDDFWPSETSMTHRIYKKWPIDPN